MSTTAKDGIFMAAALRLARRGLGRTWPNPAVGCLIVQKTDGAARIVASGWTQPGGRPHAERMALDQAGRAARGATAYVSLEPCSHTGKSPPCADALVEAGVARVVTGIEDPNPRVAGDGHRKLRDAGIEVVTGVLERQARWLALGHILKVTRQRPFIQLKLAVSREGMIAGPGGAPVRITGAIADGWVHRMRAQADAILVGSGTVLADDPMLTCRLPGAGDRSPVRVVLDSALRTPADCALVRTARDIPVWIASRQGEREAEAAVLRAAGAEVMALPAGTGGIDLAALLGELARRGITRLMVEGGARVARAFLEAGLCDEVVLIEGGGAIGADGVALFDGRPFEVIAAMPGLVLAHEAVLGDDRMRILRKDY